jgi:hypothetical protein
VDDNRLEHYAWKAKTMATDGFRVAVTTTRSLGVMLLEFRSEGFEKLRGTLRGKVALGMLVLLLLTGGYVWYMHRWTADDTVDATPTPTSAKVEHRPVSNSESVATKAIVSYESASASVSALEAVRSTEAGVHAAAILPNVASSGGTISSASTSELAELRKLVESGNQRILQELASLRQALANGGLRSSGTGAANVGASTVGQVAGFLP